MEKYLVDFRKLNFEERCNVIMTINSEHFNLIGPTSLRHCAKVTPNQLSTL